MQNAMREGNFISHREVLDMRELRAMTQNRLLGEYGGALVSFSLNIPGAIKVFPLEELAFREGVRLIEGVLERKNYLILHREQLIHSAGTTYFCAVNAEGRSVKEALLTLEEECSMGRIFDIDVLDENGRKLSRREYGLTGRKCLICGEDAFVCGRSHRHNIQEVFDKTCEIMENYFAYAQVRRLADLAVRALKEEVHVTPKPGLVDEKDNGAHTDMDLLLFEKSAAALYPYFFDCAWAGIHHEGSSKELCKTLTEYGKEAERIMFEVTQGVNTHKGAIFSLGILTAAAGGYFAEADDSRNPVVLRKFLSARARDIAESKMMEMKADSAEKTQGEIAFHRYGISGARGEAAAGFPTLFEDAIPYYEAFIKKGASRQEALVAALLMILSKTDDTNVIKRAGVLRLRTLQRELSAFLSETDGKEKEIEKIMKKAEELNREFITENISPGGSADLLALVIFVVSLEALQKRAWEGIPWT